MEIVQSNSFSSLSYYQFHLCQFVYIFFFSETEDHVFSMCTYIFTVLKKEISTFNQAGVVFESCTLNFLFNPFNLLQNLIHSVHAIRTLKGSASFLVQLFIRISFFA